MRQIFSPFLSPFRFAPILLQFVRRDILGRYRGSLLGMGWAFVTPILMLGVYTFVFVGVFRARWPGAEDGSGVTFALQLFAGLMVFNLFAEVTAQAPNLILSQPNLVKKVVFPLEILPFVALGSGLFHLMLSLSVLLVGALLVNHGLPWTVLLLPLVLLPLLPLLLGIFCCAWGFCSRYCAGYKPCYQFVNVPFANFLFNKVTFSKHPVMDVSQPVGSGYRKCTSRCFCWRDA